MSDFLIGYGLGFATCAVGLFSAIVFDVGMDKMSALYRRLACRK